ncbi:tRNA 2-thiouridine(34) synthase MnmA [Actinomyces sp. zg-332]|uniref:tRNA 2-thiouridine(34) synthase MnmA n=1 Tax=Actinomyces sp. zg-332 TaxID=2708340 RepID=UPI0014204DC2|nr:tRNA 2-thiouridine(34) synthase MnmA [Actinomyces sp. zg-332]QPK93831.1 tRNA 2-thiouridine(34) synthase MnmA [Actinomyces sp. zg-332]
MKVLAALSGGVDSAVAAARAVEAGHDVTAVHMALTKSKEEYRTGSRGCCSLEDSADARRAAAILGIPFYVWDLSEEFEKTVIDDFLNEYEQGRTPNPCVRCNEYVKFKSLLDRGIALGFDAVCTGHYAQILEGEAGLELHRSINDLKDQSYVLAVIGRENVSKVLFPIGNMETKDAVRAEAAQRGLSVSNKPDSYDICFISDGDTAGFLRSKLGAKSGEILDTEGNVVGQHEGYFAYTVGQRRGLALGRPAKDGKPRYVLSTIPAKNQVIVGSNELLSVNTIEGNDPIWLCDKSEYSSRFTAAVQMRAHGKQVPCEIELTAEKVIAHLDESAHGIAAGQSMVIYDGTRVVGQVTISKAYKS